MVGEQGGSRGAWLTQYLPKPCGPFKGVGEAGTGVSEVEPYFLMCGFQAFFAELASCSHGLLP